MTPAWYPEIGMSFLKQILVALVTVVVAGGLWISFFPGAPEVLSRWGIDWASASVPERTRQEQAGGGFGQQNAIVVSAEIGSSTINDRLSAIGTGRALSTVSVTPFAAGRLNEILVQSGSRVEAGDIIATLDSDTEEIAVDRAQISLEDANSRLERVQALRTSNTVTAVQLNEAQLAVNNARLQLRDAELTLSRRSIVAPISGIVGILPVSAGNYVTAQTEIATIDDRSRIVIDFWAPERFAGMISVGQTVTASSVARPGQSYEGVVSAVDNRIDSQSRTLRIQASIENEDDTLRAGMSFQTQMQFPGDTYPSVDPLAIQWGTDGAFVWLVQNGVARRAPVTIIQRNTESVLVSADFGDANAVVTEGIHSVREGAEVRVVSGPGGAQPQAAISPTDS
ncbi:efflux RND transporter periplasmic adaptor subunit [Mesorhizobium sp. CAU 1732]|uniref:efflux RND transporter periplasmic adaptor subunit n=1 Tax=Mesorhizobium sp. CAU 1732 TaxID=3140358 RepID=UPI0032600C2F